MARSHRPKCRWDSISARTATAIARPAGASSIQVRELCHPIPGRSSDRAPRGEQDLRLDAGLSRVEVRHDDLRLTGSASILDLARPALKGECVLGGLEQGLAMFRSRSRAGGGGRATRQTRLMFSRLGSGRRRCEERMAESRRSQQLLRRQRILSRFGFGRPRSFAALSARLRTDENRVLAAVNASRSSVRVPDGTGRATNGAASMAASADP